MSKSKQLFTEMREHEARNQRSPEQLLNEIFVSFGEIFTPNKYNNEDRSI